ncbi:MAG: ribose 5-phosphate isomerase B [Candidatus Korobacteraceae bacterium]|jgi:ribose 5-phosphate isomerase B
MKIAIGSDHGGFPLNKLLVKELEKAGHEVTDFGTDRGDLPDDYPDYAKLVAEAVQAGKAERGVLVCGSGVGVTAAANKFRGIRACMCHDTYSAHQGVEHDDMNVLCLGARVVGPELAVELVHAFLNARFTGEPRHVRRLGKIQKFEESWSEKKS